MHNRFDLHQLLMISLTTFSLVMFASSAHAEKAGGTKWKVSATGKSQAKLSGKAAIQKKTQLAAKLPAKALPKTTTAQAKVLPVSKRSPASEDAGSSTSSSQPVAAAGGNPDMPLTASPTSSALASAIPQKLAAIDPNSAVEIRGQARTLSMMLVLKNGKDSINFIKVRKDYKAEIAKTEY